MGKVNAPYFAFNRGEVSRLSLGRVDVERMRLAAETMENWKPTVLGPMTMRAGLKHQGSTRSNLKPVYLPFVFGNTDVSAIELTNSSMRFWVPADGIDTSNTYAALDALRAQNIAAKEDGDLEVLTRPNISTVVTNGNFSSSTGWVTEATDGCTSTISGGKLTLTATARGGSASAYRKVFISKPNRNIEHSFRIVVDTGPVKFRAGGNQNLDNVIEETILGEGTHSIAFTPGLDLDVVYIYFEATDTAPRIVDSITIEDAGILTLTTPWATADLANVRFVQSGDVIFVACHDVHPMKIERRSPRSWSIVKYLPENGPVQRAASADVKLKPTVMYGSGFLDAEKPFFKETHEGVIFRLYQDGQTNKAVLGAEDAYTDAIRITGVTGSDRQFCYVVSGLTGTKTKLTLERSTDDGSRGIGFKVIDQSIIKDGSYTYKDLERSGADADNDKGSGNFENVICYYRVGIQEDHYKNGSPTVHFQEREGGAPRLRSGGGTGYCRVTNYISKTRVAIEVLVPFSTLAKTKDWSEGEWSEHSGFPSSVGIHEGRLWWAGRDQIWASVSDDYANFDINKEGDAGPIQRSIGYGPVDKINWILSLNRLILGREGAETSIRSSALDEPITPTSFSMRDCSTKGTAPIAAIRSDTTGVFVGKSNRKVYELAPSQSDYEALDLTRLHPDIGGDDGFTRMAVQVQPEPMVHIVRADGEVAVLLYNKADEVEAWWRVVTDGDVEDVFVLPGDTEDNVYYVVKRTINGDTVRFLERFARDSQCSGLPEARLLDCFVVDTGGDRTITGLSHLEGETVSAWGWDDDGTTGFDLGTYTVALGKIVTTTAYDNVCVGLPYTANFKSAKLAYGAQGGTAINQRKRVDHLGLVLYDTHYQGLKYGQDSAHLDNMPLTSQYSTIAADTVHSEFDEQMISLNGKWNTDSRLYLRAVSPRPCTVASAVISIKTNE